MNHIFVILSMIKADFLERTRRYNFLVTMCLAVYLGWAVNSGQILIKLEKYRGVYNSAWVGSLMALTASFFLGLIGFYLVKNTIQRDEHTGVGQILATTSISRSQYLLGKWLSNFILLSALIAILAAAAVCMQIVQGEDRQIHLLALLAPFLFIALPMMSLVAAFAVFFESVPWLKGGFGNLLYFGLFACLLLGGVQLGQHLWADAVGFSLIGSSMKSAARMAFPGYNGTFTLAMVSGKPLQSFTWPGVSWSVDLIAQRLLWVVWSAVIVLSGSLFFDRFDPSGRAYLRKKRKLPHKETVLQPETDPLSIHVQAAPRLTPLEQNRRFHINFLRLTWMEFLLLIKGQKWFWWTGMAALWIGCAFAPSGTLRTLSFMLCCIWPVLLWSKLGEREAHYHTESLIHQAACSLERPLLASWLAGVLLAALAASGTLPGRLMHAEPLGLLAWVLSVLFIPTLALTLGIWSRSSKPFEVVYPLLWYLGPFNPQNGLALIDYLGVHTPAPVNTTPLLFAGFLAILMILALIGRRQSIAA